MVLGAGYGGILTAKKLANQFKKDDSVQITLIDQRPYHTMMTELHEVAANRVPEDAIRMDLKKVFAKRKVDVKLDKVTRIDFDANRLQGEAGSYGYDYLVLGTGSKPAFFGCNGAQENAYTLWSFEDAVRLKEQILKMFRTAVAETDAAKRSRMLTFVVVGGGFTGVEMAGELGEWAKILCRQYCISEEEVKIYMLDMLPKILTMFDDKLADKAVKRLNKLGVEVITGAHITDVNPDHICMKDRGCIESQTVIWTAGIEGSTVLEGAAIEKKERNRVVCNDKLQSVQYKNVFVVGDNIQFVPEGQQRSVPQMVENAELSASTVAKNVTASILGKDMKSYKPEFHGAMVCIGGRYGLAKLGMPNKMFNFSGFIALFFKHFINLIYFVQVLGFNKIWTYMMHEFFHVENRRSLTGGYFSKRSPNFWLVPLRMYLGFMWLTEGLQKLPKVMENPESIFLIPAPVGAVSAASQVVESVQDAASTGAANQAVTAVQQATDAVTGASAAATAQAGYSAAGEAVSRIADSFTALPVPQFIADMVKSSMDLMFYNGDGGYTVLASVFQTMMVFGEIAVGLCLLGGLFSALASIVSIGMGLMIWASGMAPLEMLWYLMASVATIGGSGSTFGLDYYVLPMLKKRWKEIGFVKKWYLYTD